MICDASLRNADDTDAGAALPQAGLAISGQEALFGNDIPADTSAGSGSASDSATYPTLRPGDRDGDDSAAHIVFMQNRLIELGYLHDSACGLCHVLCHILDISIHAYLMLNLRRYNRIYDIFCWMGKIFLFVRIFYHTNLLCI